MSIRILSRPIGKFDIFGHRLHPRVLVQSPMAFQVPLRRYFSEVPEEATRNRKYWDSLSTAEKRQHYTCGKKYVTLKRVDTWQKTRQTRPAVRNRRPKAQVNERLNEKVSLWQGDITVLEIDAIVNAANSSLLGGGGVDGAIHRAASRSLFDECKQLDGCDTGDAKITSGHRLPARRIIHTVGPVFRSPKKLGSCYRRSLELVVANKLRSVAFPCISTGIYGYPNEDAAHVALGVVRQWLEALENVDDVDRVIFCVFLATDLEIYRRLLPVYFPSELDVPSSDESTDELKSVSKQPCNGTDIVAPTASASEEKDSSVNPERTAESTVPAVASAISECTDGETSMEHTDGGVASEHVDAAEESVLKGSVGESEKSVLKGSAGQGEESVIKDSKGQGEESMLKDSAGQGEESSIKGSAGQGEESVLKGSAGQGEESALKGNVGQGEESMLKDSAGQGEKSVLKGSAGQGGELALEGTAGQGTTEEVAVEEVKDANTFKDSVIPILERAESAPARSAV